MHRVRALPIMVASLLAAACGTQRDADERAAGDTLAPAVLPGDTLVVPPAMTSDSAAGRDAAAPPAGAAQPGGTSGAPDGAKAAPGTKSGTAPGGLSSTDIAVVAGAAAQQGGLQVMPWENLTPLILTDMRALVQHQERYFAANRRYSSRVQALGASARDGWTTRITFAGPEGWSAAATQAFYPGRSCVVWGGTSADAARAPKTEAAGLRGAAGQPVCDAGPAR